MLGSTEIIIIVVVILILFGATAVPKFARSLGKAKGEFEKGMKEGQNSIKEDANEKSEK